METLTLEENKSSPNESIELNQSTTIVAPSLPPKTRPVDGVIVATGSPRCQYGDSIDSCSNKSVPGSPFCGPHGGKLTLRTDGTLGIIGPGCYRAIAQLARLNHRYVSQVLQGKSNPTSNVLERIARVVGVDVGWLLDYINGQKKESRNTL